MNSSFIQWLPFEIIEEIVPFIIQFIWKCPNDFFLNVSEHNSLAKSFCYLALIDYDDTLFEQFLFNYMGTLNYINKSLKCFVKHYLSQYHRTCFMCNKVESVDQYLHTLQPFYIRYPCFRKIGSTIQCFYRRGDEIMIPTCIECFTSTKNITYAIVYIPHSSTIFFYLENMFELPASPFYKITPNNIQELKEPYPDLLTLKSLIIENNDFIGIFPYFNFKFIHDFSNNRNFANFIISIKKNLV